MDSDRRHRDDADLQMQVQDAALQQLESKLSSSKQELEVYLSKQTPAKIWDTFTIR